MCSWCTWHGSSPGAADVHAALIGKNRQTKQVYFYVGDSEVTQYLVDVHGYD